MKADFSRFTFDPTLNVRSVLIQQGRPLDDASLNEGTEALLRRTETEAVDVIGAEGAPLKGGGFRVVKAWADLTADEKADPRNANPGVNATYLLTAGRFYVDGLQVENHAIAVGNLPITGKRLLYLRAIVDHQTGVEMPRVLDPALGDADTATRAVVRWRVGALNAANMGACGDTNADWDALIASPAGKMTVTLNQAAPSSDPCKLTPGGGYARPENLLYRVEVHDGTPGANPQPDDGPRFMRENLKVKLSRNNGMEVAKITAVSGNDITVDVGSRDGMPTFRRGEYVEILDPADPSDVGTALAWSQVMDVRGDVVTLAIASTPQMVGARIRLWSSDLQVVKQDPVDPTKSYQVTIDGLVFSFSGNGYRRGAYWTVPARYVTANVVAPVSTGQAMAPHGPRVVYAKLSLIDVNNGVVQGAPTDCRKTFEPLTELLSFHYAGGDGQTVSPVGVAPGNLAVAPSHLRAGVRLGRTPMPKALVKFELVPAAAAGRLKRTGTGPGPAQGAAVIAETGADGVASAIWELNLTDPVQRVRATLLDSANQALTLPLPIEYSASLNWAKYVGYEPGQCEELKDARHVQQALDILCKLPRGGGCMVTVGEKGQYKTLSDALKALLREPQDDVCICLLAGDHALPGFPLSGKGFRDLVLRIGGCGPASRIILRERPMLFRDLRALILTNLAVDVTDRIEPGQPGLGVEHCKELTIEDCEIRGRAAEGALVALAAVRRVHIRGSRFEAGGAEGIERAATVVRRAGAAGPLAEVLGIEERAEFELRTGEFAAAVAGGSLMERRAFAAALGPVADGPEALSATERASFRRLIAEVSRGAADAGALADAIDHIWHAAQLTRPGTALALQPGPADMADEDFALLDDNEIAGFVSLGGIPYKNGLTPDELKTLTEIARNKRIDIPGTGATVQLRANQLSGLTLGRTVVERLRQIIQNNGGSLTEVYRRCALSENVLQLGNNVFAATHVTLTSNDFSLAAEPKRELLGLGVARYAVVLGNYAPSDQSLTMLMQRRCARDHNHDINVVVVP